MAISSSSFLKLLVCTLVDDEELQTLQFVESLNYNNSRSHQNTASMVVRGVTQIVSESRQTNAKIENYELVVSRYNAGQFKIMFRMCRTSFEKLLSIVREEDVFVQKQSGGKQMVPVEKQLMLYLWFISTKENYIRIADRFGMAQSTAMKCVERVVSSILDHLLPMYLAWPSGQERKKIMDSFSSKGLQKVIGAIDGSHIPIKAPRENPEQYINRKGFHSIIIQAVCDHQMKFLDCYVGWPGSVHDSRVFSNSDIFFNFSTNPLEYCSDGGFLLGDSAYPLSAFLLTPYKDYGNLTEVQKKFNYVQSSSRTVIERAFGVMKTKFQRLKLIELEKLKGINELIHSITVIHNFCIVEKENLDINFDEVEPDPFVGDDLGVLRAVGSSTEDAKRNRDEVAETLFYNI